MPDCNASSQEQVNYCFKKTVTVVHFGSFETLFTILHSEEVKKSMLVLKTPRAARASSLRSLDVPLEVLKKSRERRELL